MTNPPLCPLRIISYGQQEASMCLEARCAWWDPLIAWCSIRTLARMALISTRPPQDKEKKEERRA